MRLRSLLSAIVVAGVAASSPLRGASQGRESVTVTFVPVADAVPLKYALQAGLFEKAGLDVKLAPVGSGALATIAVVGGAADIGSANSLSITLARSKGVPLMLVAPQAQYDDSLPSTQLLVAADSPIAGPKDLEGRTVAVAGLHDLLDLGVRAWMTRGGADPGKTHFVEIVQPAMLAALDAKRVDAIVVSEPTLTSAVASGRTRMLAAPYGAIAKRFIVDNFFGNASWLKTHREAALRFAEVMRHASEYSNAHDDEMRPLIASYTSIVPNVLLKMHPIKCALVETPDQIQPVIDAAAKYGEIPSAFAASDMIFSAQSHF